MIRRNSEGILVVRKILKMIKKHELIRPFVDVLFLSILFAKKTSLKINIRHISLDLWMILSVDVLLARRGGTFLGTIVVRTVFFIILEDGLGGGIVDAQTG